jgi:eukaryotic-like serine/threonine-protein kinase
MPLSAGTRLGPYEILCVLGAGGMGEVYRARDPMLNRDVAIKILPESVAADPERIARFEREAKILAALNHPNIAHIYGFEKSNGIRALVMELVEGPTLADRIEQGAIPLDEALRIANGIVEALEAAHEQAIIHRDLKPANIKVRHDGTVKVLDFGLAKALEPAAAVGSDLSASPTMTNPALTKLGIVLGTATYMSPEQAKGLAVDKRTDVWAFGCVLYEMLTGGRAFPGESVSDTVAHLLMKEPDWSAVPVYTPPSIRRLLHRCLAKDRKQRLDSAADARLEIEEAVRGPVEPGTDDKKLARLKTALAAVTLLALGGVAALIGSRAANSHSTPASAARLSVPLPFEISVASPGELAISPDGQTLVFVGASAGAIRLYARRLDELETRPLAGTENAAAPFFSPDGQWIAFFTAGDGAVKKISLQGGQPQVVCKGCTSRPIGGCWDRSDRIIFASWPNLGLFQVPANGGTPEAVNRPADGTWFMWPTLVADRAVLFTTWRNGQAGIDVISFETGQRRTIVNSGSHPRYLASGHLLYSSEGRLFVAPFDVGTLTTRGSSLVAIDGVGGDLTSAMYDVSSTGTLAYVSGPALVQVAWKDRHGQTLPLTSQARHYSFPSLSPDGKRFAVTITDGFVRNLWVGSVDHEPLTQLTFGNDDVFAVWTPDGERIAFTSGQGGRYNLFLTASDASGRLKRLTDASSAQKPTSISPSGNLVLFNENSPSTGLDIWQTSLDRRDTPHPYLQTRFNESEGMFSPDGQWVAYRSDETGRNEVYVQAYPIPGGKKRVSIDGGTAPLWNPNGRELIYHTGDALMAVSVSRDGQGLRMDAPELLFLHQRDRRVPGLGTDFSIAPDGQRFLMVDQHGDWPGGLSQNLNVVLNWFEELKARVPTK